MSTKPGSESDISDKNQELSTDEIIETFFPFESPYSHQREGIENTLNAFYSNGYHLLEGPCGTGKTLIALNAAIGAIRNPKTKFKRALIITSVKQQQKAFEDDIKNINEYIVDTYGHRRKAPKGKEPIESLTIVGKQDLCPYVDSGAIEDEDVSRECSSLQKSTYDASNRLSDQGSSLSSGANRIIESGIPANETISSIKRSKDEPVFNDIDDSKFTPEPVTQFDAPVCPYYAQALIDDEKGTQTVSYNGMMDAETLRQKAAQLGTCPYEVMNEGIKEAEIILGNYAHVFDQTTVEATTNSIIDEETLLIVDEGHMLVERARSQLGSSVGRHDLTQAINAIDVLDEHFRNLTSRTRDKINKELRQAGTSVEGARMFRTLFEQLRNFVDQMTEAYCNRQYENGEYLSDQEVIPLRSPESTNQGQLMKWLQQKPHEEEVYKFAKYKAKGIESAVGILLSNSDEVEDDVNPNAISTVGSFITSKAYAQETDYFTKIDLQARDFGGKWKFNPEKTPQELYKIHLSLENCIPAKDISQQFGKFGGGLVMSATLSPTEITSEIIGLTELETRHTSDEFELNFPTENRESLIVDCDRFTSRNRGSPGEDNVVRSDYKDAITTTITEASGNTLICMPSYTEGEWIGEYLKDELNIPIYIDEPSTNAETTELRRQFTQEQKAVLTTSLRGTLTEGVDYEGNDLSNVIVVGVPLTNPTTPTAKAIKNSFTLEFGAKNAFTYAFTLPAIFKTRQALGRVIRSADDIGTRVLIDERYSSGNTEHSLLTDQQQNEFKEISQSELSNHIADFWATKSTSK